MDNWDTLSKVKEKLTQLVVSWKIAQKQIDELTEETYKGFVEALEKTEMITNTYSKSVSWVVFDLERQVDALLEKYFSLSGWKEWVIRKRMMHNRYAKLMKEQWKKPISIGRFFATNSPRWELIVDNNLKIFISNRMGAIAYKFIIIEKKWIVVWSKVKTREGDILTVTSISRTCDLYHKWQWWLRYTNSPEVELVTDETEE